MLQRDVYTHALLGYRGQPGVRRQYVDAGADAGGAVWASMRRSAFEELEQAKADGRLEEYVTPIEAALDYMPLAVLADEDEIGFMHGHRVVVECQAGQGESVRMSTESGRFLGLGSVEVVDDSRMCAAQEIAGGPDGGFG